MTTAHGRILLVDDDPDLLRLLSLRLGSFGHEVMAVEGANAALDALDTFHPQTVITDLCMENMDGMELLDQIHQRQADLPVLIITAHGTIPDAVKATQQGAFGFIPKPIDKDMLQSQVADALKLAPTTAKDDLFGEIISRSPIIHDLLTRARRVAPSDSSVLITGESGTGKELLARAIHLASQRKNGPFIAVNCSAIPENLLESELFGHEQGSFTGATRRKQGLFMGAADGTLFLDEIGDMSPALQAKLLRMLQEGEIRPVGAIESVSADVRIISATHQNLQQAMEEGRFREDLYYRLNVVGLHLPPLSERHEDIPLLVNRFLERLAQQHDAPAKVYAPEAMELLVAAKWPGNIRHLYNIVEQNVVLSPQRVISQHTVREALGINAGKLLSFAEARDEFTRDYLSRLLHLTHGNVSRAAKLAKRNRTDFYKLISRFGIEPSAFKT